MVKFRCPRCGQKIAVNDEGIGVAIACPNCATGVVVPQETAAEFRPLPAALAPLAPLPPLPPATDPQALLRAALLPHLARVMKDKLLRALMTQRRLLLDTQFDATRQVAEFEQRLVRIQAQYQQRLRTYEQRIATLEGQLAAKETELRRLLRHRLAVTAESLETQSPAEAPAPPSADADLVLRA